MRIGAGSGIITDIDDFKIVAIPEPASVGFAALFGGTLLLKRRRRA